MATERLKIDPFGAASVELSQAEEARSVDIMTAVREAVGQDISLMVEMHGRFSAASAIRVIEQLQPLRPEWVEEPVLPYNPETLRRVRQATTARIAYRGASPHNCRLPRADRIGTGRYRASRPHSLRWVKRSPQTRRLGGRLRPATLASQRLWSSGNRGERAFRCGDRQFQDPRTLQRLCRSPGY